MSGRRGTTTRSARGAAAVTAVVAAVTLSAACDDAPDDTPGRTAPGGSVTLHPAVTIGELEGDPDYLFGDVRSIAVDDSARIYVGDRIGATVRVYAPTGELLAQVAQEGQGPGEMYGWPANLTFGPEGRLYVRDGSRITIFAPPTEGAIADSLADTWRFPGYGNLTERRSAVADDGAYYYPDGVIRADDPGRFFYHVFRHGERTADTLELPRYQGSAARATALYRLGRDGRMVEGLSHMPFAPVPSWAVTHAGTLLSTHGRSESLLETTVTGDTVRILPLGGGGPRPIPADELEDSLGALEARIDSLPVPLDQVINLGEGVAERRVPDALPSVVSVSTADDGSIWVQRWPPAGAADTRVYDVYEADGAHRASVILNAPLVSEPPPYFGRNAVAGVVRDAGTGVQRVVLFLLGSRTDE